MKEKVVEKAVRCKHCGGIMRMYRGGVNCMMCGRSLDHHCEYCKNADRQESREKKVA